MKRIITTGLSLVLLAAMTAASASDAGTASDPLISQSYAEGEYTGSLVEQGTGIVNSTLQGVYDRLAASLPAGEAVPGAVYSGGRQLLLVRDGGKVTVLTGGCVTPLDGSLSVSVSSGLVVDVSRGAAVDGGALVTGRRYICVEDTTAVFTASGPVLLLLEGAYIPSDGVGRPEMIYDDVTGVEWFAEAARYAKSIGMFPDSDNSMFRSSSGITRAEMVYAMWRAAGSPASGGNLPYEDLREDWYKPAVAWATEKGITNGTDGPNFSPDMGLDRQQLATMLYRYAVAAGEDVTPRADLSRFVDRASISDWAEDAMSWAVAADVIHGTSDTADVMSPNMAATRGQVATVLMRITV